MVDSIQNGAKEANAEKQGGLFLFRKAEYTFVPFSEIPAIEFEGHWEYRDGHAIGLDATAAIQIDLAKTSSVVGLFVNHDWSGKIKVTVNERETDCFDLYSPIHYRRCLPLFSAMEPSRATLKITSLGGNPYSRSNQTVFLGIFLLNDEATALLDPTRRSGESSDTHDASGQESAADFVELQVHMVDRYRQKIADQGLRFEEEAKRRWSKYRMRFGEMLVYTSPGDRVLDIGAGYMEPEFLKSVILAQQLDYWAQDIDPRAIEHNRATFAVCGVEPDQAREGKNTDLQYPDNFFDIVFSSHCLEHSDDLYTTFAEIYRIVRPGGHLFFAVPFGYDDAIEHLYAIDIDGWYALARHHGFEVINQHIGNIYPENNHDLVIVARKPAEAIPASEPVLVNSGTTPSLIDRFRTTPVGAIFQDNTPVSIHDPSLAWLDLPPQEFLDYAVGLPREEYDRLPDDPKTFQNNPTFLLAQVHRIWLTVRKIGQHLSSEPTAVAVDLGAYPFAVDIAIRDYLQRSCRLAATINQALSAAAVRSLESRGIELIPVNLDPRVKVETALPGMSDHLPFEDAAVDFVIFAHVVEHLYHPRQILEEIFRVLKPGGKLLLTTDHAFMLGGLLNYLNNGHYLHEPVEGTAAMVFHDWRGHVRFYSEGDLRTLIEACGGGIVECELHEVLYNSIPEKYFVEPQTQMPRWRATLLTEFPALRNEILIVAAKV